MVSMDREPNILKKISQKIGKFVHHFPLTSYIGSPLTNSRLYRGNPVHTEGEGGRKAEFLRSLSCTDVCCSGK